MMIGYVTVSDLEGGERIAKVLVTEKLAVCVNVIPSISSTYRFKGKIEKESESIMVIKTDETLKQRLTVRIKELHSYDVPEILYWKVDASLEINQWLTDELS